MEDSAADPGGVWFCGVCNFSNQPAASQCRICQVPSGSFPSPASLIPDWQAEKGAEEGSEETGETSEQGSARLDVQPPHLYPVASVRPSDWTLNNLHRRNSSSEEEEGEEEESEAEPQPKTQLIPAPGFVSKRPQKSDSAKGGC